MPSWKTALTCTGAAILLAGALPGTAQATGTATDCCGSGASWATGNKQALGTSTTTTSPLWFTVANGVTSEVFYPTWNATPPTTS
jgi:glucoamylase